MLYDLDSPPPVETLIQEDNSSLDIAPHSSGTEHLDSELFEDDEHDLVGFNLTTRSSQKITLKVRLFKFRYQNL